MTELPPILRTGFAADDDPELWETAWSVIVSPIEDAASRRKDVYRLYLMIGRCSHWLRPHQTRLTVAGGFAWPTGYSGGWQSRRGLPSLDWYARFQWAGPDDRWVRVRRYRGKRKLVCRIAIPSRTARHAQAVVHVSWDPGTIEHPRQKATRYFAFRRTGDHWSCVVERDPSIHERHN